MNRHKEHRVHTTRGDFGRLLRHVPDHASLTGIPRTVAGIDAMLHPEPPTRPIGFSLPGGVPTEVADTSTQSVEITAVVADKPEKEIVLPRDTETTPTVRLHMFSPDTDICKTDFATHYIDRKDIVLLARFADKERFAKYEAKRKEGILGANHELTELEYDKTRQAQVTEIYETAKRRINERIYTTIMEEFDLPTMKDAYDFYERQRKHANEAILRHGELIYEEGTPYDVNNILKLPVRPADLIEMYLSSEAKAKPQFREQIKRQLLLGHIAAEVEMSESGGAGQKLTQIQKLLDDKFYANSENEDMTHYGVFRTLTNELISDLTEERPEEVAQDEHIKEIKANTRKIAGTETRVLTKIGRKNTADGVRKAIKKAQKYTDERQHDQVRPDADVNDTHRMMVVVYGDSDMAKDVMNTVFDLIAGKENEKYFRNKDIFGTPILRDGKFTGLPTDVQIADETKVTEPGKSPKYARRRIKITFDGMPNPLEIIVQTADEHVRSILEIGPYNHTLGTYTGPAHEPMRVTRERKINGVLFDRKTYPNLPSPDDHDDDIPFPGLEEVAHGLVINRHVLLGAD